MGKASISIIILLGVGLGAVGIWLLVGDAVEDTGNCVCAAMRMGTLDTYGDEEFVCTESMFGRDSVSRMSRPAILCAENGNDVVATRRAVLEIMRQEQRAMAEELEQRLAEQRERTRAAIERTRAEVERMNRSATPFPEFPSE